MSILERRMAKLERASHLGANQIDIIIRRIIGNEAVRAVIGDQVVDRIEGEDEDAFVKRSKITALAGATRRPCHVTLLPEQVLQ
ncbi:hypothetical protein [Accumulibacter sp.]|jgi:hypothetical protein|uniref:hypothetical protein n=1 Tax=Accumulibacter sp. TaxID=2053492 RepID=UPI002C404B01|nr:hypothetical protein [Accumulibacter sp.]HPU81624.1 hypothetical protein [Accumulibacter sp.]